MEWYNEHESAQPSIFGMPEIKIKIQKLFQATNNWNRLKLFP